MDIFTRLKQLSGKRSGADASGKNHSSAPHKPEQDHSLDHGQASSSLDPSGNLGDLSGSLKDLSGNLNPEVISPLSPPP